MQLLNHFVNVITTNYMQSFVLICSIIVGAIFYIEYIFREKRTKILQTLDKKESLLKSLETLSNDIKVVKTSILSTISELDAIVTEMRNSIPSSCDCAQNQTPETKEDKDV